ncbi:uncharacterized protein LOC141525946 [Cotesia typhae]|uniref:uncharacterized protein LOC141525946 n=1 Tax=Cotesia typhae TaxID=2053667 RepID=UPI003D68301F
MNQFKHKPVTDKLNKQSEKCVENAKQRLFIQGNSSSNVYPARQYNINFNGVNYMNNIDSTNALSFSHSLVEPSDSDPLIDELDLAPIWNPSYETNPSNLNWISETNSQITRQTCDVSNEVLSNDILKIGSRLEKDCNTPILQVSSKPKSKKKASVIVRLWELPLTSYAATATTTIVEVAEKELAVESTASARVDESVDQINDFGVTDKALSIGALATFLKNEGLNKLFSSSFFFQ